MSISPSINIRIRPRSCKMKRRVVVIYGMCDADTSIETEYLGNLLNSKYIKIVEDKSAECNRPIYDIDINTNKGVVGITLIASHVGTRVLYDSIHIWIHDSSKYNIPINKIASILIENPEVVLLSIGADVVTSVFYDRIVACTVTDDRAILGYLSRILGDNDSNLVEYNRRLPVSTIIRSIIEKCHHNRQVLEKDYVLDIIDKVFSD